ncbi:hypothetical protein FGO68_gene4023 [Halteria grandinella]|uniref:Uncharacterized protein n=1 Tax=Halteria grandinella TaxID=5974 RepID=A0A8J8NQJ7_HALGN|nr:hypothetical protein FGO68_gene4023 [Halteria grandinella]
MPDKSGLLEEENDDLTILLNQLSLDFNDDDSYTSSIQEAFTFNINGEIIPNSDIHLEEFENASMGNHSQSGNLRILKGRSLAKSIKKITKAVVKTVKFILQEIKENGEVLGQLVGAMIGLIYEGPEGAVLGWQVGGELGLSAQNALNYCYSGGGSKSSLKFECINNGDNEEYQNLYFGVTQLKKDAAKNPYSSKLLKMEKK